MSVMIGRIYFRRNLAYHVYGVGRRSYPLRAHASSQSLCRCKELAPLIGDMNYSHNPRYSNIQTLHSLDIRQMSTIRSCLKRDTSEIPILNCTSQGIYIFNCPSILLTLYGRGYEGCWVILDNVTSQHLCPSILLTL